MASSDKVDTFELQLFGSRFRVCHGDVVTFPCDRSHSQTLKKYHAWI